MNASTFYIEHLIVGSITIIVFAFGADYDLTQVGAGRTPFWVFAIIPTAYLLGIVVHVIGQLPEIFIRYALGDSDKMAGIVLTADRGKTILHTRSKQAVIIGASTELGNAVARKRSRDRIIRGCVVSIFLLCIFDASTHKRDTQGSTDPKGPAPQFVEGKCLGGFRLPPEAAPIPSASGSIWRDTSVHLCLEPSIKPWIVLICLVIGWSYLHLSTKIFKDSAFRVALFQLKLTERRFLPSRTASTRVTEKASAEVQDPAQR